MKGLKDQSIQKVQIPFTTPRNSIPDGERLFQEPLCRCAQLRACVPVLGQQPWRFQVIYQLDRERLRFDTLLDDLQIDL
jgi:hypothetical protein